MEQYFCTFVIYELYDELLQGETFENIADFTMIKLHHP